MPASPAKVSRRPPSLANEPRDFREATSEQSRYGVSAETEPIANACRDSDHILQGPGQLDADHIVIRIEPERWSRESLL